ncbi:hypothetical protein [Roseibium sp.]|uniref:hypothetical protein n=1 Tax=Roseibium sp. TaxID=1936156 RepID=UPI003B510182
MTALQLQRERTQSGYGSTIDGIKWEAETVTHEIIPDQGWVMTVDVETQEKAA